jgi:hypothetical protein
MRRHAFIPSSPDPLEARITPGHAGLAGAGATAPAMTPSHNLNLYGLALGQATTRGTVHLLLATDAMISPLRKVTVTGYLVIPNTVGANRLAQGFLTISNPRGEIRVSLNGTVTVSRGSFTYASGNLTYEIAWGSRADHGATGTGTVLYSPGPVLSPGRFLLDFGNYPPPP